MSPAGSEPYWLAAALMAGSLTIASIVTRREGSAVAATQAALGTTVQVETVHGEQVDVDIPAGTQPHETLIVRSAGMPSLRGRHAGNLRVVVNVVIPRHLSKEQRELVQQLADSMTEHNLRNDEGLFGKLKRAFGG